MTVTFNPLPDFWDDPGVPQGQILDQIQESLNVTTEDSLIYGSPIQFPYFNCLAWALGVTDQVLTIGPNASIPEADVITYMTQRGIQQVPEGYTMANIIAWGWPGSQQVVHFSVKVAFPQGNLSWSSKLGFTPNPEYPANGLLVSHSEQAPEGQAYGEALLWFYNPGGYIPPPGTGACAEATG